MFKIFEVKEGKLTFFPQASYKNLKGFFIIFIVIAIISALSGWLKFDEKDLWKIYHLLVKELNLKYDIPEIGPSDSEMNQRKLDAKVELEVDEAIKNYWKSLPPEAPRMTNKTILEGLQTPRFSESQRMVVKDAIYYECPGGAMGIRGVWVDSDPECN